MSVTALCVAFFQSLDTVCEGTLKHASNEKGELSRSILTEQVRSLLHENSQFMGEVGRGAHDTSTLAYSPSFPSVISWYILYITLIVGS